MICFCPSQAHAQGYWTPAYVGYGAGCTTVAGVSGCVSAAASCQSYADQDVGYIVSFVPARRLNAFYNCTATGHEFGITPIYLNCPVGQTLDPNSYGGCTTVPATVQPPKRIGGEGMCPPPAEWSSIPQPCQTGIINGDFYVGEPISVSSGNVFYAVSDYETAGQNKLRFTRYYNSRGVTYNSIGANWRTNFDRQLFQVSSSQVLFFRASGQILTFTSSGGVWRPDTDTDVTFTWAAGIWTVTDPEDTVETYGGATPVLMSITARNGYKQTLAYNASGKLATVTDSYGRVLTFNYNPDFTLASITTPDSTTISYGYTASISGQNLTSVTYPTSQTVTYAYGNTTLVNALTAVIDENSNQYLAWTYDAYGRGLTSQVGNGPTANITTVTYNDTTGARTVTNALGVVDTYSFSTLQNVPKVTGISRAATATTPAMSRSFTYDTNGFLASQTDWNGNSTTYTNNAHGKPTTINEAVGSSVARTTTITYDTTWVRLPASIVTPGVTTSFTYDTSGETLTKKFTDTTTTTVPYSTGGQIRTWTNTWSNHLLASVQNPRTDVTATTFFTYGSDGALLSVEDPMTHTTNITSHTGGGRPLTIVDPNTVTTTLTYDGRQRPLTSAVSTTGGTRTTSWAYANSGDVTTTLPDGSEIITALDGAHRNEGFSNNLSEQYVSTLDALGDPVDTSIFNGSSTRVFDRTGTFDALGRQLKDTSTVTSQSYVRTFDNNGNALTITDPLSHATTQVFDALNRLYKSTDASSGITQLTFDAHNRPLTVSDPNSNVTSYVYDGFGDRIQEASPDRGTTVYHFDGDGNLTQKVDAASVTTNYTYDKLDRPLTKAYPADSTLNVAYTYDQTGATYGKGVGRLTSLTDAAGSLSRSYDERGNILTEKRINGTNTLTTTYTYDGASRIASITYPSGAVSSYTRDAAGYVTAMPFSATGADLPKSVNAATHIPFGPVNHIAYDQGDAGNFTFDADYRLTNLEYDAFGGTAYFKWTYAYDNANNVSSITDGITSANSQTLGYDALNRLTSASSTGTYGSLGWTYDHNGNLATRVIGTTTYTSGYSSGTNRLATVTWPSNSETVGYTATGNINAVTINSSPNLAMTYSKANRLTSITGSGVSIALTGASYDAFGKRITKGDTGFSPILYSYDLDGNLIEENDGGTVTDYIYLDGINVANWAPSESHLYAINFDSRGVAQVSRDEYGLTNWAAFSQPYGSMTQTVSTGSSTGPVTQNLRLPGQYFDTEAGFHYNGFRDYMPGVGRYMEADPTGLSAGTNLYAYALGNPLRYTDRHGLVSWQDIRLPLIRTVASVATIYNNFFTPLDPNEYQNEATTIEEQAAEAATEEVCVGTQTTTELLSGTVAATATSTGVSPFLGRLLGTTAVVITATFWPNPAQ